MQKQCKICNNTFDSSPNFLVVCGEACRKEARRLTALKSATNYYYKNKEKIRKKRLEAAPTEAKKLEIQEARRKYREANKAKIAASYKAWYAENMERRKKQAKEYRKKNSEELKKYHKEYRDELKLAKKKAKGQ